MKEPLTHIERPKFFKHEGVFLIGFGLIGLVFQYPWAVFFQGLFIPFFSFFSYKPLKFSWRRGLVIAVVITVIVVGMWYTARSVMGFSDIFIWKVSMLASIIVGATLILTGEVIKKRH